mgnify:CR=1 FL=1
MAQLSNTFLFSLILGIEGVEGLVLVVVFVQLTLTFRAVVLVVPHHDHLVFGDTRNEGVLVVVKVLVGDNIVFVHLFLFLSHVSMHSKVLLLFSLPVQVRFVLQLSLLSSKHKVHVFLDSLLRCQQGAHSIEGII